MGWKSGPHSGGAQENYAFQPKSFGIGLKSDFGSDWWMTTLLMDDSDPSYVHYRLQTAVDRLEHRLGPRWAPYGLLVLYKTSSFDP